MGWRCPTVSGARWHFPSPEQLELTYRLENTGDQPFPYLWAAHPQFVADEQTRIVFPPEVKQVVNVIEDDPLWGEAGALCDWPAARGADGVLYPLDRVRSASRHACRKFYLPPEQPVAWAALLHEGKGCRLQMAWSPDELPYLGLWVDEGMYNSLPAAAFEPSNAYYDSLTRAIANQKVTTLSPGEVKNWRLQLRLSAA